MWQMQVKLNFAVSARTGNAQTRGMDALLTSTISVNNKVVDMCLKFQFGPSHCDYLSLHVDR